MQPKVPSVYSIICKNVGLYICYHHVFITYLCNFRYCKYVQSKYFSKIHRFFLVAVEANRGDLTKASVRADINFKKCSITPLINSQNSVWLKWGFVLSTVYYDSHCDFSPDVSPSIVLNPRTRAQSKLLRFILFLSILQRIYSILMQLDIENVLL